LPHSMAIQSSFITFIHHRSIHIPYEFLFHKGTMSLLHSHSPLSVNLTVNGLWNTYLNVILSVPICKVCSFVTPWDLLVCQYYNGLGFHCLLQLSL
jgi:hypothetical protein